MSTYTHTTRRALSTRLVSSPWPPTAAPAPTMRRQASWRFSPTRRPIAFSASTWSTRYGAVWFIEFVTAALSGVAKFIKAYFLLFLSGNHWLLFNYYSSLLTYCSSPRLPVSSSTRLCSLWSTVHRLRTSPARATLTRYDARHPFSNECFDVFLFRRVAVLLLICRFGISIFIFITQCGLDRHLIICRRNPRPSARLPSLPTAASPSTHNPCQ